MKALRTHRPVTLILEKARERARISAEIVSIVVPHVPFQSAGLHQRPGLVSLDENKGVPIHEEPGDRGVLALHSKSAGSHCCHVCDELSERSLVGLGQPLGLSNNQGRLGAGSELV